MQTIISKATAILDENNIPPFTQGLYQMHLKEALLKIVSPDVIKNFHNYRLEPKEEDAQVTFYENKLSVVFKLLRYQQKTGFRKYTERFPNFLIQVDIDGSTTVQYRTDSGYKTLLTNELHIPCNLKF